MKDVDPIIKTRKGKILLFDFNNADKKPLELALKSFDSSSFNPHGLSLYHDPESLTVFVFVINHKTDGDVVEIFNFDREDNTLVHRRSIRDKNIYSGNDLVAVGKIKKAFIFAYVIIDYLCIAFSSKQCSLI